MTNSPISGKTAVSTEPISAEPLIEVQNLDVQFPGASGPVTVIDDLSLAIHPGEILGLVGESGCGKSMLARSIMGLVPSPGRVSEGRILFKGTDLLTLDEPERRSLRGNQISIILQEPMTTLNPVFTVGNQIEEVLTVHRPEMKQRERRQHAIEIMRQTGIPSPEARIDQYPHELSGGIRQRVTISMALIGGNVQLLIADEPTTALDVTIQAQILNLFVELQEEHQMSLLLITHDLGVVAQTAHRVAVMYAGRLVEIARVEELFDNPKHPYTRGLMRSLPRPGPGSRKQPMPSIPGTVPSPGEIPQGCSFYDRCSHRDENQCLSARPTLEEVSTDHWVSCHRKADLAPFAVTSSDGPASSDEVAP